MQENYQNYLNWFDEPQASLTVRTAAFLQGEKELCKFGMEPVSYKEELFNVKAAFRQPQYKHCVISCNSEQRRALPR